ncbi:MAG: DNA-directed RNA polymerase subunit K [Nanoarchaeota archaeon]|nr:DNA-directed RNA polymerase subunit K [Nanoarchaeota archaeon]
MAAKANVTQLNLRLEDTEFTSYEKARMIGSRALQISQGAAPLIKLTKKDIESLHYNPIEIAKKEFEAGKIPLSVKRASPEIKEPSQE